MLLFEHLGLSEPLTRAIKELGYEKPSSVQEQTLPVLLTERTDFIGLAATGTGKTAAFGIPMLENIDATKKAIQAVVLCPTRELALQVSGQINLLGKFLGVRALPIYGGAGYEDQMRGLRAHPQVIVATPGRLIDHLERKTLKFNDVTTVVLDEADEMISMGFKEDLEIILKRIPRETSKIWLFSATMSPEVRRVADEYLQNPKMVRANRTDMLSTTVEQIFYKMNEGDKPDNLRKIIDAVDGFYGLIFCQTKLLVTDLTQLLNRAGYNVDCLHGDKTQVERERTMRAFRERKISILVCTDVASRGLDVKDVTHVINYSIPRELDIYVHRIGRTARSGKSGVAISLVTRSHWNLIARIEHMTKSKMTEGKLPTRKDIALRKMAALLKDFQAQQPYEKAAEFFDESWKEALASLNSVEIAMRFITMQSPGLLHQLTKEEKAPKPIPNMTSRNFDEDSDRYQQQRRHRSKHNSRPHYGAKKKKSHSGQHQQRS